jgi:hypothetical protein
MSIQFSPVIAAKPRPLPGFSSLHPGRIGLVSRLHLVHRY